MYNTNSCLEWKQKMGKKTQQDDNFINNHKNFNCVEFYAHNVFGAV